MSTRHIILGLLVQEPMSGYDIKSLFKGLSWLIDTPSYGSLYPALHSLLEDQFVTVDVEPNPGKPPRKLYSITDKGRRELHAWVNEPSSQGPTIKSFVRQLLMASSLSEEELREHLARRRSQVLDYLKHPDTAAKQDEADEDDLGQQLVHDYSAAIARAELLWLEGQLAELA